MPEVGRERERKDRWTRKEHERRRELDSYSEKHSEDKEAEMWWADVVAGARVLHYSGTFG